MSNHEVDANIETHHARPLTGGEVEARADEFPVRASFVDTAVVIAGNACEVEEACGRCLEAQGASVNHIGRANAGGFDIASEADWESVAAGLQRLGGRVDIVVLVLDPSAASDHTTTDGTAARRTLDGTVIGSFLGLKHLAPLMPVGGVAVLVSVTSFSDTPRQRILASTAVWALRGLARSAAVDLASKSVRVVSVIAGAMDRARSDAYGTRLLAGRACTPSDIASAVAYVAAPEAGFFNGTDLVVDGGVSAQ